MSKTRERVDPQLATALAAMPAGLFDYTDIPKVRTDLRTFVEAARKQLPNDPAVTTEDLEARDEAGGVPVRLFRPIEVEGPLPVIVWFHGGGMVAGFAAQEDQYLKSLAKSVKCVVLSVDYRLSPENRPPAAVEDGFLAYRWVINEAQALGLDARRVGIAGASGGGGIAAALALMIRDRNAPSPLFQSLLYPMLDDRLITPSSREIVDVGVVDRSSFIALWKAILGDSAGGTDVSPYAAPARATTLSALPAAFIAVGELDVLRDESVAYASRLWANQVATELHVYPNAYHAWDEFAPDSDLAKAFSQRMACISVANVFLGRVLALRAVFYHNLARDGTAERRESVPSPWPRVQLTAYGNRNVRCGRHARVTIAPLKAR